MNTHNLYNTILYTLRQEDLDLSLLSGEGIFYAPELYIAFLLGKAIKKNELDIFGQSVEWIRESSLGDKSSIDTGLTDFAFKAGETTHVFELKLRSTIHAYDADIQKLMRFKGNYKKYLLAIVDTWEHHKHEDDRIVKIGEKYGHLGEEGRKAFMSFPTYQNRYDKQIFCTVALWCLDQ